MTKLLAIEWDAKEARVVVGRERAGGVLVEQAFVVPLAERGTTERDAADAEIGAAIGKALAEHGLSRVEALVAVGRSNIELKFLSTPPVPPEELPDLVRFQAMRQFTSLGDDWPLDFVPLAPNADGGLNVLAAAISPELVGQIRKTCTAAGAGVSRLVLRPFAAASLLAKVTADGKCRMMVDLLRDDADLTVLIGPQVIFPRTVRLPAMAEPEALARVLLAEGRRTMIAAQNQLGGRRVEEVVIFGDGSHHSTLKALLEQELKVTVTLVDPFDKVELAAEARASRPEYPGTFAPLLGMLLDEAAHRTPVIDFLHPRKKPTPPNKRRLYTLAAGAAAAVVLLGVFLVQMRLWALDDEIKRLNDQIALNEKKAKDLAQVRKDAALLDQFAAADVNWLDELARTSQKFPPAGTAQVNELRARYTAKGGGRLTLKGVADQAPRIGEIERVLRDEMHSVEGKGRTPDPKLEGLTWRFDETIVVDPQPTSATQAAAAAPGAKQASARPTAKAGKPAASAKAGGQP